MRQESDNKNQKDWGPKEGIPGVLKKKKFGDVGGAVIPLPINNDESGPDKKTKADSAEETKATGENGAAGKKKGRDSKHR